MGYRKRGLATSHSRKTWFRYRGKNCVIWYRLLTLLSGKTGYVVPRLGLRVEKGWGNSPGPDALGVDGRASAESGYGSAQLQAAPSRRGSRGRVTRLPQGA